MLGYRIEAKSGRVSCHGYLWMKKVVGFDDRHHCAKCLKGAYENNFGLKVPVNVDRMLEGYGEGDLVYVCAVSRPYNWHRNRHLAVRVREGASASLELFTGDVIHLTNAEQIRFSGQVAAERYADKGREFVTCRNFQFGAQLFSCQ